MRARCPRRCPRRLGALGAALGALLVTGCATTGALAPPPLPRPTLAPPLEADRAGAVWLSRVDAPPGVFTAAFVVRGGPLDEPLPGLGEIMVDAALLGTGGDPSREEVPSVRALALGAELRAVANGRVLGWWVRGPARRAPALVRLLLDVGLRASFPATRVSGLVAQRRAEAREAGPEAQAVMTAAAIAAGVASGAGGPVPLTVTDDGLRGWNRELLARFARRMVRPERAAFVWAGGGGEEAVGRAVREARARLSAWGPRGDSGAGRSAGATQKSPGPEPASRPVRCPGIGRSAHLVLTRDGQDQGRRLLAFVAYPAPGPGDARRAAFEVALNALGAADTGALAAALGPARAARRPLALLDLGGPGPGRAVLLVRVGGRARPVLADLWKTLEAAQGVAAPADREAAAGRWADAARQAAAERLRRRTDPATGVLEVAGRLVYGARPGPAVAASAQQEEEARAFLRRHGATVVGVGPAALGEVLKHLGPLTVWSGGGARRGGAAPPRCP